MTNTTDNTANETTTNNNEVGNNAAEAEAVDLVDSQSTITASLNDALKVKSPDEQTDDEARKGFVEQCQVVELKLGEETHKVFLPKVNQGALDEVKAAAMQYAAGQPFDGDTVDILQMHSKDYTKAGLIAQSAANALCGEKQANLKPFAKWADSLCAEQNGVTKLTNDKGLEVLHPNKGVLADSILVAMGVMINGGKFEGFNGKLASRAIASEVNGEGEEITGVANVKAVFKDNGGSIETLLNKVQIAAVKLEKSELGATAALLQSQMNYTGIEGSYFASLVQAIIYGKYAATCKFIAGKSAMIASKCVKGSSQEKIEAEAVKATRRAIGKANRQPVAQQQALGN